LAGGGAASDQFCAHVGVRFTGSVKPDDERDPAVSLTIGRAARLLVYESIVLF